MPRPPRKTELDRVIEGLNEQIIALVTTRDHLEAQRAALHRPAQKPPTTPTTPQQSDT